MAKSRSKHQSELYNAYKSTNKYIKNRTRKLQRALKRNPENTQIEEALKNISYRRKTPKASMWGHSKIADTMLFAKFKKNSNKVITPCSEKQMYSIKERVHIRGVGIWNS